MDALAAFLGNIGMGFAVALTWQNLLLCFIGCLLGTIIGVLPGIGPLTTMAMVLPFTFWLGPVGALIMLSGVFYGAQYGGSTTAILVKIPGETSSVITVLDGHAMAQRSKSAIYPVGVPQIQLGAGPTKWPRQAAQQQAGQTHGRRKSAEPARHVPQPRAQEQDIGDDIPGQRR